MPGIDFPASDDSATTVSRHAFYSICCIQNRVDTTDNITYRRGKGYVITKVLIVDDHASVRDGIRAYIENKTDFTVCGEADNGPSAVKQATALEPDVIILDLALPMLNGVEAASVLKSNQPHVKIVAFSMFASELGRAIRAATRIDAVLAKSASLADLMQTIRGLVSPANLQQPGNPQTSLPA